jgi:adenosine deaminase CECR1
MPKGALLHAHLEASVNAEVLLRLALQQPAIHVRGAKPINASTIAFTLPEFKALPQDDFSDGVGLTEPSYVANDWVSIRKARGTFDQALGGPLGFDKWVTGALTINPNEAYRTHNTVPKVPRHLSDVWSPLTIVSNRSGKSFRKPLQLQR